MNTATKRKADRIDYDGIITRAESGQIIDASEIRRVIETLRGAAVDAAGVAQNAMESELDIRRQSDARAVAARREGRHDGVQLALETVASLLDRYANGPHDLPEPVAAHYVAALAIAQSELQSDAAQAGELVA